MSTDILMEKWAPVLDHNDLDSIQSREKKAVVAQVLENTEKALHEEAVISEASLSGAGFGGAFSGAGDNATINATINNSRLLVLSICMIRLSALRKADIFRAGCESLAGRT